MLKTESLLKTNCVDANGTEFTMERGKTFTSGKRDRLEIVSAIIAITQQPSSISRIIGHANLNYSTLKDYVKFMIGRHLIEERKISSGAKKGLAVYKATEKGSKFLELYCEGLILLHGENFLQENSNLAEAYLIQYCRKNKLPINSKLERSLNLRLKNPNRVSDKDPTDRVDKSLQA